MKAKIKKLICFTFLISILATALLFVTACDKKTEEHEVGNQPKPSPYHSTYRTNGTVFDIGDVPIEWSFGWYDVYAQNAGKKTSYIKLYFLPESEDAFCFVKQIDDDFFFGKIYD